MNVLAVMPWYPANAARFFVDAFEHLGHKVFRVGPTYFDHYGLQYAPEELPMVDQEFLRNSWWQLDSIIDAATRAGFSPDLIFLSEENYQNQIGPTTKVPVVLWSADGWPNCYERRNMIQPTLAYTNHPLGVNPAPRTTIPEGWKFMPGAADLVWHAKEDTTGYPIQYGFCLLATMYGPRKEICEKLSRDPYDFSTVYGQLGPELYRFYYSRSLATYHNCNGQAELKWRYMESAAMGCINICDKNFLLEPMGFWPWVHYVPIGSFTKEYDDDLWPSSKAIGRAILHLNEYPDISSHISRRARAKVERHDRYENRVRLILNDLGYGKCDPEIDIDYDQRLRLYMGTHDYIPRNALGYNHNETQFLPEFFHNK